MVRGHKQVVSVVVGWLVTVCVLIMMIVMVGGITRLTQSGLSMVDWQPIMGMVPPLSEADWQHTFLAYQQYPEYQQVNEGMSLSAFKRIFFWEYVHRMLGRLIGLAIIIPLIVLWQLNYLTPYLCKRGVVMSILVVLQGIVGWLMVKSGLVDRPHVSHFRLAFHLGLAFWLFVYTWWTLLKTVSPSCRPVNITMKRWAVVTLGVMCVQIVYGAFVAGLKAGLIMNTFPKMGETWMPDIKWGSGMSWLATMVSNPVMVQWVHRFLAWVLLGLIIYGGFYGLRQVLSEFQRRSLWFLLVTVFIQFSLGVLTLIYAVPLYLAVGHQLVALVLLTAIVTVYFGSVAKYPN